MELSRVTDEALVKQHNTITSGRYDFSACQLDVLFMLLATLNEEDEMGKEYHIRVKDIELITGRKWNYQQLKDGNENLLSRVFEIQMPKGLKQIVLFNEVQYLDGTGSFYMKINESARPYFFDLKNNFTLLELKSVLSCTSKHAKRIYSLCCQWRGTGGQRFDLGEFKEMLGLKDPKGKQAEQYSKVSMFKSEVLDRAKKQINENTNITFDYELKKIRGRAFDTIIIYCGATKPNLAQMEIDFRGDIEKQKKNAELLQKIENIKAIGIRDDLAELWAVKYWKEFVSEKNNLIEQMQKGKAIENKAAYLAGVFKKKGHV
ncbi:replication initiation protein [Flavobacterium degerlachei]|jgi:plasmid replication initiation protein|uniref:Initiator Replication protein n=1 Tax=Flavobacterium degerlachei TaxID=229203 RepID=A0A1H3GUW3_9FLAO|nr:replication initiation protein [Flavobacterium degerlachei]SDY06428.1 Initiator Replication protein [Flavobacterium degerlachei]